MGISAGNVGFGMLRGAFGHWIIALGLRLEEELKEFWGGEGLRVATKCRKRGWEWG